MEVEEGAGRVGGGIGIWSEGGWNGHGDEHVWGELGESPHRRRHIDAESATGSEVEEYHIPALKSWIQSQDGDGEKGERKLGGGG